MEDLAERFVSSTYGFAKALDVTGSTKKTLEASMAEYRVLMMKAKKFRLDDDFVELSARASVVTPEDALARVQGTILPYDVVWMEYNPRVKVAASIAMSEAPDRPVSDRVRDIAALLLVRDRKNANAFSIQLIGQAEIRNSRGIDTTLYVVHPMAIVFDADGQGDINRSVIGGIESWRMTHGGQVDVTGKEGLSAEDLSASVWGYVRGNGPRGFSGPKDFVGLSYSVPSYLTRHAAIAYSDAFRRLMVKVNEAPGVRGVSRDSILDQFATDVAENAGMTRWISTVLCMLSEVPIVVSEPRTATGSRIRSANGTGRPGFEKHVVTLNLPRVKSRVRYVARKIAGGGRKKRHEVQSHWRTYLTDVGPMCIHRWTYSEDLDHRTCETCGSFSTKIKNHLRGDESLGWATREVRITARKKENAL